MIFGSKLKYNSLQKKIKSESEFTLANLEETSLKISINEVIKNVFGEVSLYLFNLPSYLISECNKII